MTVTTRGVRVSWNPRSTPVTAIVASIAGTPKPVMRRYRPACSATTPLAPNHPATVVGMTTSMIATRIPMMRDSQSPSTPV